MVSGGRRLIRGLVVVVLFGWWIVAARAAEGVGGLRGSVVDADEAAPLANARVSVLEAAVSVTTSAEGIYSFDAVPPGTYTVSVAKDGYVRKIIPDVVVQPGQFTEVRVELAAEVYEMEEFVVRGFDLGGGTEMGLLEIRQESTALSDAISAELMRRAGASTAAGALRLVVGTSVQEGKYVVIRGLADRYTTTLLNEVRLPTSDADKRAVQLDQFPAAQIQNITVYKSFTPDQQGDSTGGTVDILTKSVPDKGFLSVSGGVEYNTQTTGNDKFLSYRGGGTPTFGLDHGKRDLPFRSSEVPGYLGATVNPTLAATRLPNAQLLDAQTRAFEPVLGVSTKEVGPGYNFGLAGGEKFNLGGAGDFGFIAGYSYKQDYKFYDNGQRNIVTYSSGGSDPSVENSYNDARGTDEVQWSATLGLGYQLDDQHSFDLNFIHNQTATDEARFLEDRTEPTEYTQSQSLRYRERTLQSIQLGGDHRFDDLGGVKLDWVGSYNTTRQYEPDQRFFKNAYDPINQVSAPQGELLNHILRVWRDVDEESKQGALNLTVPFRQWTDTEGFVKVGPFYDEVVRKFRQDSFTYAFPSQAGPLDEKKLENLGYLSYGGPGLWTDVFLEPHRIGFPTNNPPAINQLLWHIQPSNTDVDYRGEQIIMAGYGMVELPLTSWFKIIGGARYEMTDLSIAINSPNGVVQVIQRANGNYFLVDVPDSEAGAQLKQWDLLPALGAVWEIIPKLYLRANWSRTIARPTFRELAPVRTFEFLGADQFVGNPDLRISQIENYDLRLEWFRRPGDVLAASVFYKEITDPIELISFVITGGSRFARPLNYPEGKVFGVEFEARQRLDILAEWLADVTIGGNAAWITSEVTLPADEQASLSGIGVNTRTRPLLGQPEYLLNANIVYDNSRSGTAVGLFYTFTGEKLVVGEAVSDNYNPNVFELPVGTLDLSIEQKIGANWRVTFRAKNLTNPRFERAYRVTWDSADIIQSSYRRGVDFSLGATYSW